MPSPIETILAHFTAYLSQIGYSKGVQQSYPKMIHEFIEVQGIESLADIEPVTILSFYDWVQHRPLKKGSGGGLSSSFISHHVGALQVFFNWLLASGQLEVNPMSILVFPRPVVIPREPLSLDQIEALFAVCESLRERAVLHLFYSCGLRCSEGVSLNRSDIHFKTCRLYVRSGKGSKRRCVPMPEKVAQELEQYYLQEWSERPLIEGESLETEAFICGPRGKRLRADGYRHILKRLLARADLPKEIVLHQLRHSIATHLLESGLGVESVREFLGHSSLESTQIYTKVRTSRLQSL
jgi:integrase/recombinase XerD